MKKIVIASSLKPVDDIRACWKIGQSLGKGNKYEINIIGNASKKTPELPNIQFHPHHLQRLKIWKRLTLPITYFVKLVKINPHIVITCTHDLLLASTVYAWLFRKTLIYDVRENYLKNALHLRSGISRYVGYLIRWKEYVCAPFVHHFTLAEDCYKEEIPFVHKRHTVLENRAIDLPEIVAEKRPFRFLISGTLSHYAGIYQATRLFEAYSEHYPATLHIIGQVHDQQIFDYLKTLSESNQNVSINISQRPIPYPEILREIKASSIGITAYQTNNVNRHKMPTKVYEYARFGVINLVQTGCHWTKRAAQKADIIAVDFANPDSKLIHSEIERLQSAPKTKDAFHTWEEQEDALQNLINKFN